MWQFYSSVFTSMLFSDHLIETLLIGTICEFFSSTQYKGFDKTIDTLPLTGVQNVHKKSPPQATPALGVMNPLWVYVSLQPNNYIKLNTHIRGFYWAITNLGFANLLHSAKLFSTHIHTLPDTHIHTNTRTHKKFWLNKYDNWVTILSFFRTNAMCPSKSIS